MGATEREKEFYGDSVQIVSRSEDQVVYRIANDTGQVVMTSYQIFPGIELIYNDVHIRKCGVEHTGSTNAIEINHCREGRIECELQDDFFYLTQGDLAIANKHEAAHESYFPSSHYHGISVLIEIEKAPENLARILEGVDVSPAALIEKFCNKGTCFVTRSTPHLEHIFSELYMVPDCIRKGYFKLKVLELLLFLSNIDITENETCKRSVKKSRVTLAKNACSYLTEHMDRRVTIAALAELFHVSQTALKNSFKDVYGVSIYSFIRAQKMQAAALMLRQTEYSVLEIAGKYGYDNGSKFAGAFKNVMGMTPNEYRYTNFEEDFILRRNISTKI